MALVISHSILQQFCVVPDTNHIQITFCRVTLWDL